MARAISFSSLSPEHRELMRQALSKHMVNMVLGFSDMHDDATEASKLYIYMGVMHEIDKG